MMHVSHVFKFKLSLSLFHNPLYFQSSHPPKMAESSTIHGTDRVSLLPESLLHHILSFLTTKQAARTSSLSKQWQHLWTCVPALDVSSKDMRTQDKSFEQIMFKILVSGSERQRVRKVSFFCDSECDYVNLGYLLYAVLARNVEEFGLFLEPSPVAFELPRGLWSYRTLVVLKLNGSIGIKVDSSSVEFLRLRVMHLDHVFFKDDGFGLDLALSCPVLDELVIRNVSKSCGKVIVRCNCLRYLTYKESSSRAFEFGNLDGLIRASVEFCASLANERMEDILRVSHALRNVRTLDLDLSFLSTHSCDSFPEFPNMVDLKLRIDCCSVLGQLLHKLPRLKNLIVMKPRRGHICGGSPLPDKVPKCLSSTLITFTFRGFEGSDEDVEFVGYVMERSEAMENVIITTEFLDGRKMAPVLEKLMAYERGSSGCLLRFVES